MTVGATIRAKVRPATPSDLFALHEHHERHVRESGRDGDFIFSPVECGLEQTPDQLTESSVKALRAFETRTRERWSKAPTVCDWERTWVIADSSLEASGDRSHEPRGKIYGDINLVHRPPLASSLHRATLMMGIERSHRGQGFGSELMTMALDWARAEPSIEWLQLFVFGDNLPAQALYRRFGFVENGRVEDMFRVYGVPVTDISMVLRLR